MPETEQSTTIRLGLPKGRMHAGVMKLLADAGIDVRVNSRGYRPRVSLPGVNAKILKPQNIIEMLHAGSRDLGFAGSDWVAELGYGTGGDDRIVDLLDTGLDRVKLVVAAPPEFVENGRLRPTDRPLRVAAEMTALASDWFQKAGVEARIIRTYGATEVFPPEDADCVVDIAASGDTLRANGLTVVDTVASSSTRLLASREAWEDPARRPKIESFLVVVRSVLEARSRVMIDLNVTRERLETVVEALPSMREPTVSQLRSESGFAVRAAVPSDQVAELVPVLSERGATDIVVTRPTQIVP
ncbi:MAG: ATP phosphoribosyltransferase [Planctomycetota bacterium]